VGIGEDRGAGVASMGMTDKGREHCGHARTTVSGVGSHAALEGQEDEVGAAADAKFVKEVGNVKLDGALGDIELAGDFLVREILEERIENFLLAAAEIGDRVGFEAARLSRKN